MNTILRIFLALLGVLAATAGASAQRFTWSVDFGAVFDNREGDGTHTPAETYFFTRLAPEIGLAFGERDRIAGGVVWTQPIGREWGGHRVSPTLYYRHEAPSWAISMGMFPRTQLREELPGFLWCDSLMYFQRNIRGALVQYAKGRSFVDLYLDWRQLQTNRDREAFNVVLHGQWHPRDGRFFAGGHAMMNHLAKVRHAPADQHVVDNFVVNPYVGVDLSHATPLDSLRVRAGAIVTLERNRAFGNWRTPAGGWLDVCAEWRWLGLYESLYAGGVQQPSHSEFGSLLYQGEPFYTAKFYSRTDVYAHIVRNRYVDLKASLNFNVTSSGLIFYQRLMVDVYLPAKKF